MKYFHDISAIEHISGSIVTVGVFDGIHLGHKAIFNRMRQIQASSGGDVVVITFHPHPKTVLNAGSEQKYIHSTGRKADLLARLGVDVLVDIKFDQFFSLISTEYFIEDYIVKYLHPSYIVVGYDCHFGHCKESTIDILKKLETVYGYTTIQVPPVYFNNTIISSSAIRSALNCGDVETANNMLGYEYYIYGQVVYGQQIGRTIGFPTANLFIENGLKLITANGVYACKIKWHGNFYQGMCNIGTRPTLNGSGVTIEVNIFDFCEDVYGENICVYFYKRIRSEVKFNSITDLKYQLEKDRDYIRDFFVNDNN